MTVQVAEVGRPVGPKAMEATASVPKPTGPVVYTVEKGADFWPWRK